MNPEQQSSYWNNLTNGRDPDIAVIDPLDVIGRKNRYIAELRNTALLRRLEKIPDVGRVLDFGCGSGVLTEFLYASGLDVVGVDISGELLKHSQARCQSKLATVQYDGLSLPFADQSFRAIVTYVVLNYLSSAESLDGVLSEIHRTLTSDGQLFAVEQVSRKNHYCENSGKLQYTIEEFNSHFNRAGFVVESVELIRFGRFPFLYPIKMGLVPAKCNEALASVERLLGRLKYVPHWDYTDVVFELKKS